VVRLLSASFIVVKMLGEANTTVPIAISKVVATKAKKAKCLPIELDETFWRI
jgi:hypothetical protein